MAGDTAARPRVGVAPTGSDRVAKPAPVRRRLAKAGLLSLVLLGVAITPVWMGGLIWSVYLVVRWLVG